MTKELEKEFMNDIMSKVELTVDPKDIAMLLYDIYDVPSGICEQIKNMVQRLEAIDNANLSEALKCLDRCCDQLVYESDNKEEFNTIKQALLKAQKEHKALEIIKKKRVDMWHLVDLLEQTYEMYLAFCKSEKYEEDYILTEEEFDLLKEVLE